MGNFFRGILIGIGLGFLVAPMRGEEMRRLLGQRFQELRNSLPEGSQVNQYTQQISQSVTQGASTLKDYAQQATAQVKETASNLSDIAQNAGSSAKDTASNLGSIAQNAGSDAKGAVSTLGSKAQDVAQQAASTAKNVANNAASTAQNTVQQTTSTAKNVASSVTDAAQSTAQQTVSKAQNTASNVANGNTATHTASPSLQNVQPSSSTLTGDALSTIPGIEPEIRSKLEAQGIYSTQQLLDQTSSKDERIALSQKTGVSTHMLKMLSDRADLMRIQGVNADVATMIEEAGVSGSKDLRRRNPEHLYATLKEAQQTGNNAYSTPDPDQLTQWIADAMALTSTTQE